MRDRDRIVQNLESSYRTAFQEAEEAGDKDRMTQLDFDFQRDQLYMEVLLDLRSLLESASQEGGEAPRSLLDRAKALKDLTRLR